MWRSIRKVVRSAVQLPVDSSPAARSARSAISCRSSNGLAWDIEGLESRQLLTADLAILACGFCQSVAEPTDVPAEDAAWSAAAPELVPPSQPATWSGDEALRGPLFVQSLELTPLQETLQPPPLEVQSPATEPAGLVSVNTAKLDASVLSERGAIVVRPGLEPAELILDMPAEDAFESAEGSAPIASPAPMGWGGDRLAPEPGEALTQELAAPAGRIEQLAGRGRLASNLQPVTQAPLEGIQNTLGWLTDEEYRRLIGGEDRGRLDHFQPAASEPGPGPTLSSVTHPSGGQAWPESTDEAPALAQPFNVRLGIRNWLTSRVR